MTRAVRDRILKEVNGSTSDHLSNHIHLTNCIHLKNQMHKRSPSLTEMALMRDLNALQRSRSLRDPAASPHSWHSPSVVDLLLKRGERNDSVNGRRSVEIERPGLTASGRRSIDGILESRRLRMEESRRVRENDDLVPENVGYRQDSRLKTLTDELKDIPDESDDSVSFRDQIENMPQERGVNFRSNRANRRRYRGSRRNRAPIATTRDAESQNEISDASNTFARQKYLMEEGIEENMTGVPKNGCGIPINWSRIHNGGKSFIDMAGRSLSCGLSESRLRRGGSVSKGRGIMGTPVMSEHSGSSDQSNGESLPLLNDDSGSHRDLDREKTNWRHDYSGELGIFADNLLNQETESDHPQSEHESQRCRDGGHLSLTQKYMPMTFRDLVGQNLVAQALSNAVVKRKVGLLYLFHGPNGTGKTSCARIFARALNCQSLNKPKPCGSFCNSCIGKNRKNVIEIGPVSNMDLESVFELLGNTSSTSRIQSQSQHRVFIFDECDSLAPECWGAILKVIDRAPNRVVLVLVCSSPDILPHVIVSRCQKFFFPKLKEADMMYTLQWIATKEGLKIDKDALKLIASRSDGSLRDAEMTLEQLSLLGKRVSLGLVQELVGLVSDEKLVDLLDLALSADTVNTVKNLRDIMESGIEPLALMSQLATVITDILAGSYNFKKDMPRRKFFRRQALSKEDMEKLRQALKTLSEAEKQLRVSNDRITWLTAALLQLAPDQQYLVPKTSGDTSFNHSPLALDNKAPLRERPRKSNADRSAFQAGSSRDAYYDTKLKGVSMDGSTSDVRNQPNNAHSESVYYREVEEVWVEVLEKISGDGLREFLYREGKLVSLSYGTGATVQLLFYSQLAKSKADKFRLHIVHAFESVLGSPVTIEIMCESRKDVGVGPILLPTPHQHVNHVSHNRGEIVEESEASPKGHNNKGVKSSQKASSDLGEIKPSLSLVRNKVSLGNVIHHAEGCSQHSGWSRRKAVSIAEKLEQENLRMESRSRGLLCWKAPRETRRKVKVSRVKIRMRKSRNLLKKFVSCGRCISGGSPR